MIVGLTGGIGSGKSEVSHRFEQLGVTIVDADLIARQVVAPNTPALSEIAAHFGRELLNSDGSLNRTRLRQIIFTSPNERIWLESLLHPIIRQETQRQLATHTSPYCILVSPLLLETDQFQLVDRILVVDTNEQLQTHRAAERDQTSTDQIQKIIATQLSRHQRLNKADDVIVNQGTLAELGEKVHALHKKYLAIAQHT